MTTTTTTKESKHVQWAKQVAGSQTLTSNARLVALVISLRYMDWNTLGDVRPGVPRLATDTSLSASSVQRALHELVEAGFFALSKKGGTGRASLYRGTFPRAVKAKAGVEPMRMTPTEVELPRYSDTRVNGGFYDGHTFADLYENDPEELITRLNVFVATFGYDDDATKKLQDFLHDASPMFALCHYNESIAA